MSAAPTGSTLVSNLLDVQLDILLLEMHLLSEGAVWLPGGRVIWGHFFQHLVDLFEGETLGFWDKEEGEDEGNDAKAAPHKEDLSTKVGGVGTSTDEVWGDDTNDAVPEPVGGGGKTHTTGTDWQWEKFTNDNPGGWTPGHGEDRNVQADESDHS